MKRYRNDPPHRARPRLLTKLIESVQLEYLTPGRDARAQTFGEDLLVPVVSNNAEGDHGGLSY